MPLIPVMGILQPLAVSLATKLSVPLYSLGEALPTV